MVRAPPPLEALSFLPTVGIHWGILAFEMSRLDRTVNTGSSISCPVLPRSVFKVAYKVRDKREHRELKRDTMTPVSNRHFKRTVSEKSPWDEEGFDCGDLISHVVRTALRPDVHARKTTFL